MDLRLDEDSVFIRELRRMPYTLGVSAEFTFHENEELSKRYRLEIIDEVFIRDFAIVGDAGNVNSSGIRLREGGTIMTVKELTAALGAEQVSDLAELNKKLDALIDGETEAPAAEETPEEEVEADEEATEEAAEAEEATEETAETEEAEAEEESEELSALATAAQVIKTLQDENTALKAELDQIKAQLSARSAEEKEFVAKFKTLFTSSGTERVATDDAAEAADDIRFTFTDGIGEV